MQEKFLTFMNSTAGRGARLVMGIVLAIVGLSVIDGVAGTIIALVALVPIAGGLFDVCMAGQIMGYGIRGAEIRQKLSQG